jgi:DNA-binding transcriptional MerR regulator
MCLTLGSKGTIFCHASGNLATRRGVAGNGDSMDSQGGAMQTWTAPEVARMIDIPYRTFMNWIEGGLFVPASYAGGRGVAARFSAKDVRELFIYRILRKHFSAQQLGSMMASLRAIGHNPLSRGHFIVVADDPSKGGPYLLKEMDGDIFELSKKHSAPQFRLFPFSKDEVDELETVLIDGRDKRPILSVKRPRAAKK